MTAGLSFSLAWADLSKGRPPCRSTAEILSGAEGSAAEGSLPRDLLVSPPLPDFLILLFGFRLSAWPERAEKIAVGQN